MAQSDQPEKTYTMSPGASGRLEMKQVVRSFDTGATRSVDNGKLDYEGFLHPLVLQRFGEYMHKHRVLPDGQLRDSDNWQKGIPDSSYMKSGWRHFMDWWLWHRRWVSKEPIEEALCALLFNVSGYLLNRLLERDYGIQP